MAHEFFHQWNVERIRPLSLEPFSFEHETQSNDLWFAEGVTSYYTGLSIRRAGLLTDEEYASQLTRTINAVLHSPGREMYSAEEMSSKAPFMDRASAWDRTNSANTFISYYTWGSAIGLALDLSLRSEFDLTLDDFMRLMWDQHGAKEIPYTSDDLKKQLTTLTVSASFTENFFGSFIEGHQAADYKSLLKNAGFVVRLKDSNGVFLRTEFEDSDSEVTVSRAPVRGASLFNSGLDLGDRLISIDDMRMSSAAYAREYLLSKRPGDQIRLEFLHRGLTRIEDVDLLSDPSLEVVSFENSGIPTSAEHESFRASWLDR
jgi:predicted metalloprotease with PDZ domain